MGRIKRNWHQPLGSDACADMETLALSPGEYIEAVDKHLKNVDKDLIKMDVPLGVCCSDI